MYLRPLPSPISRTTPSTDNMENQQGSPGTSFHFLRSGRLAGGVVSSSVGEVGVKETRGERRERMEGRLGSVETDLSTVGAGVGVVRLLV